jgi:hypothetical protein
VGSALDEDNQSLLGIDTSSNRFCLVGLVRGTDAGPLPNREVIFEYRSNGTIKKGNAKRVAGDFSSVDLTLTIEENGAPVFGPATVTSGCRLKGKLQKSGDQGKARLKCDLGEKLSALGLSQSANRAFLDNVEAAFPRPEQKHVKINTKKGKIRITHNGEPAPDAVEVPLSCSSATPG